MNILIVEDEKIAARRLERLVRELWGERVESLQCRESLRRSEEFLQNNSIDVLFLDLNLNGEDGFSLLQYATSFAFQTIVVSANTDRALKAFEYGVLDFIPKPFTREQLQTALERVESRMEYTRDATQVARQLAIRNQGSVMLVSVDDVLFFKGAGDYVEIHLKDTGTELHSKSLEALQKLLPVYFIRVHKSYLVDMRQVSRILVHGGGKYELELHNGAVIPLSRNRYKEVQELLDKAL
jgi:DNA-binding LytR/AlgR family response regulator